MNFGRHPYQIEKYLETHSTEKTPFYHRYVTQRYLLEPIYFSWPEGFPSGNDHGWTHIERVLERLDQILLDEIDVITPYELFLAMMSILHHDWAIIIDRKDHAETGAQLIEKYGREFGQLSRPEQRIISACVASHSSETDIKERCQNLPEQYYTNNQCVRPHLLAALVRLADELDEDERRAPERRSLIKKPSESSWFYWRFCQCIQGIRPFTKIKEIQFFVELDEKDLKEQFIIKDKKRAFLGAFAEKLEKINNERRITSEFLPDKLKFDKISVTVLPLNVERGSPPIAHPKTFVFDNHTRARHFLGFFPELTAQYYNEQLLNSLKAALNREYDEAQKLLNNLEQIIDDLPILTQLRVLYNQACYICRQLQSKKGADDAQKINEVIGYLDRWLKLGQDGAWHLNGMLAENEIYKMARDTDLYYVIFELRDKLINIIPSEFRNLLPPSEDKPSRGFAGGGGCIPRGTMVRTINGLISVESLRENDEIIGIELGFEARDVKPKFTSTTIEHIHCYQSPKGICINSKYTFSSSQPLYCISKGWICAGDLQPGMELLRHWAPYDSGECHRVGHVF